MKFAALILAGLVGAFIGLAPLHPAPRYAGLNLGTAYSGPALSIDAALAEWRSQPRRMGCVTAARWFSRRVPGFYSVSLWRVAPNGRRYQHTVAFNGVLVIDLQPLNDAPPDGRWLDQWASAPPDDLPAEYYGAKVPR